MEGYKTFELFSLLRGVEVNNFANGYLCAMEHPMDKRVLVLPIVSGKGIKDLGDEEVECKGNNVYLHKKKKKFVYEHLESNFDSCAKANRDISCEYERILDEPDD